MGTSVTRKSFEVKRDFATRSAVSGRQSSTDGMAAPHFGLRTEFGRRVFAHPTQVAKNRNEQPTRMVIFCIGEKVVADFGHKRNAAEAVRGAHGVELIGRAVCVTTGLQGEAELPSVGAFVLVTDAKQRLTGKKIAVLKAQASLGRHRLESCQSPKEYNSETQHFVVFIDKYTLFSDRFDVLGGNHVVRSRVNDESVFHHNDLWRFVLYAQF